MVCRGDNIKNGKYHVRAIYFQDATFDSIWNRQKLRESTARDMELNPIFILLTTIPECPDRD